MITDPLTIGADGSLRLVVLGRHVVLRHQQVRILAMLWDTAGKQLPIAGLYALVWQAPFHAPRRPPLTQSQRASAALSVRRLYKVGLVRQPRPQWLALTPAGAQLMHALAHEWAEWEIYQQRFLDADLSRAAGR
jgi:hypothetical protein